MKHRHIELVNTILQAGSLSAAARLLGITQPVATRTLQQAEGDLGYALFVRRGGRLQPTEQLLHLAPLIRQACDGLAEAQRAALNLRSSSSTETLRVGIVLSAAGELPRTYQRMAVRQPVMRCEFSSGHYNTLLRWLLMHEIDVAIALEAPPHPALTLQPLGTRRLVIAARPELLGRYRRAIAVPAEALRTMPLIEVIHTDPVGAIVARLAAQFAWPFPAPLAVRTHQTALDLAAHGHGVAVVDDLSAARYAAQLHIVPIEPVAPLALSAMSLKSRPLPTAAAHFVAAFAETVGTDSMPGVARVAATG